MPPVLRSRSLILLALLLACSGVLSAQEIPPAPMATATAKPPAESKTQAPPHKFWDTENIYLFSWRGRRAHAGLRFHPAPARSGE